MKIIHVVDSFRPRLGYQEIFLAREQARQGNEVYVVTSDRYSRFMYSGNRKLLGNRIIGAGLFTEEGIKVWRLKTILEIHSSLLWILGLEDKLRELDPDVIHMHGIANITAPRIARLKKKQANFKLIFDDHGVFNYSRSKLYPLFKWTFSHLIQETADALVGVADECKIFMNKRYGIPLEHITVIPLGADDILFHHDAKAREEIREQLGISNGVVFIYTGKITLDKGVHLLVEAGINLIRKHGNLKIIILGGGSTSYINDMKQRISSEGLEDYFVWLDTVPNKELYKFYSAADVAVWLCSVTISTLEAMACGLPVIVSNLPAATERVDYNNGLVCRDGNAAELEKLMEELLLNQELRIEMGRNGRKAVEEKLSWRIIARQFIELVSPE